MATPTSNSTQISFFNEPADNSVASIVDDAKWGGEVGTGATVSYSFPSFNPSFAPNYSDVNEWGEDDDSINYSPLNANQQQAFKAALDTWANVANIIFVESVDDADTVGEIRVALSSVVETEEAIAYAYNLGNYPAAGDIWLNPLSITPSISLAAYTYEFNALIHEIGHAINLKHPFDAGISWNTVLPTASDHILNTVMSYTEDPTGNDNILSRLPATPMVLDIEAIQHVYGANETYNTGDDIYTFRSAAEYLETLWDAGGTDSIVFKGNRNGDIDLRAGRASSLGKPVDLLNPNTGAVVGQIDTTVWIAKNAEIENAEGNNGDNKLTGNGLDNVLNGNSGDDILKGKAGDDVINGGDGDDVLQGHKGADIIDGGNGNDTYRVHAREDSIDNYADSGADGATDTLDATRVNDVFLTASFSAADSGIEVIVGDNSRLSGGDTAVNWDFSGFTLTGIRETRGSTQDDSITGSAGDDKIRGRDGDDILDGGAGADRVIGGSEDDQLNGNSGDDILKGGGGSDTLIGGTGNDKLNGGSGTDTFVFDTNPDTANIDAIVKFESIEDVIALDDDIFTSLTSLAGDSLSTGEFKANASGTADDADDRIIYNLTTGDLFYDADGAGDSAAVKFAQLKGSPSIDADDFILIA